MNKKMFFLLLTILLFQCTYIFAQDFKKRYSFAKAYFGVDFNYVPAYGNSYYLDADNSLSSFQRNAFISPAINFGASHFWGYTDFYVSINTTNFKTQKDNITNRTTLGALGGFRIYPMPLNDNKLRPFVGYKFSSFTYTQKQLGNQEHTFSQTKSMLDIGVGYKTPSLYIYASYNAVINPQFDTYISRNQKATTTFPSHFFNFGINWTIETTSVTNNNKAKQVHQLLDTTNIAGFFFGAGPSSAFQISSSKYLIEDRPFLNDKTTVGILPDISIGYHFTKQDFIIAMAFRPYSQTRKAFNFEQKINRKSIVLEAYKFLFDYHGFAPFIGGGASYENLHITEIDNGQKITNNIENKITPIITAGWDIRPARKSDVWLLRTNLRYAPILKTSINNKDLSLQHLEFNFIQFVIYPSRIKFYKR